jgi:hypothetical protein
LVAQHGGMNQPWLEALSRALKDVDAARGTINGLGTASAEDIGTSGDKVPMLNAGNVFSKAQTFDVVTLIDAPSIAWDWSLGPIAKVTLKDNRALAAPTNIPTGKAGTWSLFVRQDAVGGRTLTPNAVYLPPGGEAIELSTDPYALDIITFITDGERIGMALSLDHKAV